MSHLLHGLLRFGEPLTLVLLLLEAAFGSWVAFLLLPSGRAGGWGGAVRTAAFGGCVAVTGWVVFETALHSGFNTLSVTVPAGWAAGGLLLAGLGAGAASVNQSFGRRSARNAMLAGSLAASGVSCMQFTAMAGAVRPFALAYDLSGVLATVTFASALFGLAFWEGTNAWRRSPMLMATGLAAAAMVVSSLGSLASILPFEGWMDAIGGPDDLSSTPLVIIVASEAALTLALGLFGSLVDNRTAARDRVAIERLRELAGSTFEAIVIHRDGQVLDGNDMLADLTGQPLTAFLGKPVDQLCADRAMVELFRAPSGGSPLAVDILGVDGLPIPAEVLSRQITYAGRPAMVSALRDVRERRKSEARIAFLARHDALTGLANRVLLTETIAQELGRCGVEGRGFGVLCLDLDGFKMVNDTLGHAAGDELLRGVAERVRREISGEGFAARLGGDEFVVLSMGVPQAERARRLAGGLVRSLGTPFSIEGREVRIGVSIGIATFPHDGRDGETLLRHADIALYRAKQEGRGTFCCFSREMGRSVQRQGEVEQALRGAFERDEFSLTYQPIVDAGLGLAGFECLLQWSHPRLGEVSPSEFMPIAERTGLIHAIGAWVLRTACAAAVGWPRPYRVAVNVSPRQLARDGLVEDIESILRATGLEAARLELEITESSLIANQQRIVDTMNGIGALGVRLVLDDFGTGYSSLSYLHRFPFCKLKLDRSFVQRVGDEGKGQSIVRAIILLSRSLGLAVTAEGVETQEQFAFLCREGCNEMQGFLLGRPVLGSGMGEHFWSGWCGGLEVGELVDGGELVVVG